MSSKRALRRRGCRGKHRHDSFDEANGHIAALFRSEKIDGRLMVYHCGCGGWHVGHVPRPLRRTFRRRAA